MAEQAQATLNPLGHPVEPFQFYTSLILQEATGLRAGTLPQLCGILKQAPESCVYYHTHHFLFSHQYLSLGPTNDFAYWVSEMLDERKLGERLAGIDVISYANLSDLRAALVQIIDQHLAESPTARLRFAADGQEFFFIKSVHVVMPTRYVAANLAEFVQALEQVSPSVLYYHMFDARLRLGKSTNDFALWLKEQLGLTQLAVEVAELDPYGRGFEALRAALLSLVRTALQEEKPAHA